MVLEHREDLVLDVNLVRRDDIPLLNLDISLQLCNINLYLHLLCLFVQ